MNIQHYKWRNCLIVGIKSYQKSYNYKITIKDLYNFNIIWVGNCYKSLTFWIRGIGRAFWSWDSIDIFYSMLQRNHIKKIIQGTRWICYYENFVFKTNNKWRMINITNLLTSGDISCQFPFSVRVTCYTLVNTQHSTMVNIVMKKILMLR